MLTTTQSITNAQPAQDLVFQVLNFDLSWLENQTTSRYDGSYRSIADFSPGPVKPSVSPIEITFGQIDILWKLDRRTLERMATNPCTPVVVLERLADHPMADVRAAVADNQNTPGYIVWSLSEDSDPEVRFQLAENPKLPVAILLRLTADENPYVASRAQATCQRINNQ